MLKIVENVDELNNEEDIIRAIRKQLLTQYTYSPCTLRMMGLSLSEEWK